MLPLTGLTSRDTRVRYIFVVWTQRCETTGVLVRRYSFHAAVRLSTASSQLIPVWLVKVFWLGNKDLAVTESWTAWENTPFSITTEERVIPLNGNHCLRLLLTRQVQFKLDSIVVDTLTGNIRTCNMCVVVEYHRHRKKKTLDHNAAYCNGVKELDRRSRWKLVYIQFGIGCVN